MFEQISIQWQEITTRRLRTSDGGDDKLRTSSGQMEKNCTSELLEEDVKAETAKWKSDFIEKIRLKTCR